MAIKTLGFLFYNTGARIEYRRCTPAHRLSRELHVLIRVRFIDNLGMLVLLTTYEYKEVSE